MSVCSMTVTMSNPFLQAKSSPGDGEIHLVMLPPSEPAFKTLNFTYPLKLVSSTPHTLPQPDSAGSASHKAHVRTVPLVFLLSYGGGLLPPDTLTLKIKLEAQTRLTITTQGSTKIFPSPPQGSTDRGDLSYRQTHVARQDLDVKLGKGSALLLSPDPSQPFRDSNYSQNQIFEVDEDASLGVLDWVTSGRPARNEVWQAGSWKGKNEIWQAPMATQDGKQSRKRLILRDAVLLDDGPKGRGQSSLKAEEVGVFGTLILFGPLFEKMGRFFTDEYALMPRIGGRDWGDKDSMSYKHQDTGGDARGKAGDAEAQRLKARQLHLWRQERQRRETSDGIRWTAARLRGSILVKFTAPKSESLRTWLGEMFREEGTVATEFGPGGMLSLR